MALIFPDGSYTTNELPAGGITTLPGANTTVANPNYADLVAQQYAKIGRSGFGLDPTQVDQEGFNYWTNQLQSGALDPNQFQSAFLGAAAANQDPAYQAAQKAAALQQAAPVDYGNVKFTTAKQDKASDFAEKYLGTSELTPEQLSFISQNYTGTNLENTVKLLAEQEKAKQLYQSTLGREPTAEELSSATKQYNWKNIGEGVEGLLQNQVITGDPTIDYVVTQAYKSLGREGIGTSPEQIDQEGFDYWKNELAKGNITVKQFNDMFNTAAEEVYIKQAYQDVLGREAEKTGLDYWKQVLNTTNKKDIYNQIASGALTGSDVLEASKYLTGAYTPEAVQKYIQAEDDLLNEYETFREKGIDPTKTGLGEDYFSTVSNLYGSNVDQTINNILGTNAANSFTAEQKQSLIDNLLSGKTTRDDVAKSLRESGANKNQEASRIASLYANAFGGTTEDAKALAAKLLNVSYSGTGKVSDETYEMAKTAFDKALNSETDAQAGISTLVKKAANTAGAENQQFFKDNPDLLTVYKDVGETKAYKAAGTGGQYGYYQGIPILKASEVDEVFEKMGTDYIQGNAPDRLDNDMGWDTGSLSAVESRGAAALGVRKQQDYDENGNVTTSYSGDMNKLASQLGVDPTKYKDTYKTVKVIDPETGVETTQQVIDKRAEDQLYDAINEKAKDFYFIAGKTGSGKVNSLGETSAFTRDDISGNHAAVLYKKEGDKLIPIPQTLKYYNGQMELSPGSWFSQTFGGLASIPGIAELSLLIPGVGPGTYAALKAAQTAALGGEFKDIAKSGALAFAGAKYLPQVTSGISEGLSNAGITNTIANKALTSGLTSAGVATLTGKDIDNAGLTGLITGGAGAALSPQIKDLATALDIPSQYHSLFANTLTQLAPTILTGGKIDPTKLLMSYAMSKAKDTAKTTARGTA